MHQPIKKAVLLLAHGSPDSAGEVPEFLLRVTSGRPLPPHIVDEVQRRYALIGQSPLTAITLKQGELLEQKLGLPVYVGMRNWKPFVTEVTARMASDGIEHAVVICLAPHNSRTSVGLYRASLRGETPLPFTLDFVESWHDHPLLIKAFAEKLRSARENADSQTGANAPIIFTAHSVPQRTIADGDPYEAQARETAGLVAREASLRAGEWSFAFQSQGQSGGEWIGPTVESAILALKQEGHRSVLLQPVGFLCDHVEILYDIDIAFKAFSEKEGLRLFRTESLNHSPLLTAALADIARARLNVATRSPV